MMGAMMGPLHWNMVLTCFPTRTMEVLQHHDSPWQPADIALSPNILLLDFNLPNFINHYIARPLMFTQ
jgi:hypothetical protein